MRMEDGRIAKRGPLLHSQHLPESLEALGISVKVSLWTDDLQTSHEWSQHFRDNDNALCHAPAMF
jgi:hypothetical protein